MVKYKIPIRYCLFFLFILVLSNCATRKAPGGGPVDRIPPQIISTFPNSDSLNVSPQISEIEILFSERMDQSSLRKNVFISPPLEYEIEWDNWEGVNLLLKDTLIKDQTYVISIASGVQDLQKNSMASSYQLAFSTGDYLDKNSIDGTVFGLGRDKTVNLFGYILSDTAQFTPEKRKPYYISKTGKQGRYQLSYLKNGTYRILAVDDANYNLLLDASYETVGIPYRDVILDTTQSRFSGLNFQMTQLDTTAPQLIGVRPQFNNLMQVRLSEPVVNDIISSITVMDSASADTLHIKDIRIDQEFDNIMLCYTEPMDSNATYKLQISHLQDSLQNTNDTIPEWFFQPSSKIDTSSFKLMDHQPKDSVKNISTRTQIELEFTHPVDRASIESAHSLVSIKEIQVHGTWEFPNSKMAIFNPSPGLEPDSAYNSILNLNEVTNVWGKVLADTVHSYYFSIVPSRDLGEISGKIDSKKTLTDPVYLNLRPLKRGQKSFTRKIEGSDKFRFTNLPEGNYLLNGFIDQDGNGRLSKGNLFPFSHSEIFHSSTDTIAVRKRWEKQDIKFYLPVPESNYGAIDSVYKN